MGIERLMKWKGMVSEILATKASLPEITGRFRQDAGKILVPAKETKALYQWLMEHHLPMCASGYLNYFQRLSR
jgi:hypothetical protein